jgi:hypothetical protein
MDIKSLMIGDLVYVNPWDDKKPTYPSRVTGINYNSWRGEEFADWVDCEVWDEISLDSISPIPLTNEILEKNGFEKIKIAYTFDKYRYHCTLTNEKVFIDCIPYNNENLIVPNWFGVQIVNNELDAQTNLNSSCTIPCAYVHELQHAFHMIKRDKTADNIKLI